MAPQCPSSGTAVKSCMKLHFKTLTCSNVGISQMFLDSKGFLVIIFTILLGFSVMFHILVGPYNGNYSTPVKAFVSIFELGILGFLDRTDFAQTQSAVLTLIFLIVLVLVVFIIALVSVPCFV